ncbi:MAG: InlB B-repeat-containing protein [Acholeplasma sp.]
MKKISTIIVLIMTFVLVACNDLNTHTINFELNGGSNIPAIEFNDVYMVSDIELIKPEKAGHTFSGWYLDESLAQTSKLSDDITTSVTLYAKWEVINYSISFEVDGELNEAQKTEYTIFDSVELLSPTRSNYTFLGWFDSIDDTEVITSIPLGTTGDLTFYAKWEANDVSNQHVISFNNYDGSLLEEVIVESGQVPVYSGQTPTKPASETHTYVFIGWDMTLIAATQDAAYVAVFDAVEINLDTIFDAEALNAVFNFDIYNLLPQIITNDYELIDNSDELFNEVYIDLFDWNEDDLNDYDVLLDAIFEYDDIELAYIVGDYYLYLYADDEVLPGQTVYGIGIYIYLDDETPVDPEDPMGEPFDKDDLNALFGFDIYALLPAFQSSDVIITDFSDVSMYEVYVDIFTWSELDADNYEVLLEQALTYDATEESYILGDYFVYIFIDEVTYDGLTVFGIGIYGNKDSGTPVDPEDPTGVPFDKDDLNALFGFDIYALLPAFQSSDVIITDFSDASMYEVYVDIFTWSESDADAYDLLLEQNLSYDATEDSYVLGDYFVYIFIDEVTYDGLTVFGIGIYGNKDGGTPVDPVDTFELWSDVVSDLEVKFDDLNFNTYMPVFDELNDFSILGVNANEYIVETTTTLNTSTLYANYVQLILNKGFNKDEDLSTLRGHDVYVKIINDDLAYGIYLVMSDDNVEIILFSFDAVLDVVVLESLSTRQTINEYEVSKFGMSGLPSTGQFDVLVIPVEINGVQFDSDYLAKLDTVFNGTSQTTGWESVSSYYYKSSYGKLDLSFDIVEKYTTSNNQSFYESKQDAGDQYAILETLNAKDSSIDFSKYDSNNDGVIDSVIFIYSVDYDYDVNPWWAWVFTAQEGVASSVGLLDGKVFDYYFWASYSFIEDAIPGNSSLILNSETYIHELGHLMGMVDFYPYEGDYPYGPLGGFDMMDYNVGDHGPFTKLVFGWLEPLVATNGSYEVILDSYSLDDDGLNNTLLIPYNVDDLNDGNAFDEYLLVMFYTPNGLYNGHLDYVPTNAGVVVYHVDARPTSNPDYWGYYFINDNEGTSTFIVQVLEADKNNSIPGHSTLKQSDLLTSGTINLNTYTWNQGGNIHVSISITSSINNDSNSVTLSVNIS